MGRCRRTASFEYSGANADNMREGDRGAGDGQANGLEPCETREVPRTAWHSQPSSPRGEDRDRDEQHQSSSDDGRSVQAGCPGQQQEEEPQQAVAEGDGPRPRSIQPGTPGRSRRDTTARPMSHESATIAMTAAWQRGTRWSPRRPGPRPRSCPPRTRQRGARPTPAHDEGGPKADREDEGGSVQHRSRPRTFAPRHPTPECQPCGAPGRSPAMATSVSHPSNRADTTSVAHRQPLTLATAAGTAASVDSRFMRPRLCCGVPQWAYSGLTRRPCQGPLQAALRVKV